MIALIVAQNEWLGRDLRQRLTQVVDNLEVQVVTPQLAARALATTPCADAVFLADDNSPRQPAQLVQQLKPICRSPLIVVAPASDTSLVLAAIRNGASDFLDLQGNLDADLAALVARLQSAARPTNGGGRTIAIVGASGGCGASTLAANLALALATPARPTCLIDLCVSGGDLAVLLNLNARHTIVDLCIAGKRVDDSMFQNALVAHARQTHLLAAPPMMKDYTSVDAEVVRQVCEMAKLRFARVIIDLDDAVHREQARVVHDCDLLVIPLRLDFPCILKTRRLINHLCEEGIERTKLRLVVNRFGGAGDVPRKQAVEALGSELFEILPDEPATMLTSVNVGQPVVLEAPHSKVGRAFRKLAERLEADCCTIT